MRITDLSKTASMLDAYDRGEVDGESVGEVFGLDTSEFNDPEDCKKLIRPGQKDPPPGYELSFVRKMVMKWKKQNTK